MNVLVPQLQEIVDERARRLRRTSKLLGQMNEAWGTEYTRVSEIIGANGELKQSVIDVTNAKRAQILLDAHEDYINAMNNIAEAERGRNYSGLFKTNWKIEAGEKSCSKCRNSQEFGGITAENARCCNMYGERMRSAQDAVG